ncbi:proline/glycine betaine ABC transporter permease, partial [Pseudomonas aeruginosa]
MADWVKAWVDALVTNYGDLFRKISDTLLWAIVNLEGLLRATPWWLLLAIVAAIASNSHQGVARSSPSR